MKKIYITTLVIIITAYLNSNAQEFVGIQAEKQIKGAALVKQNELLRSTGYVKLNDKTIVNENAHLAWLTNDVLKTSKEDALIQNKKENDKYGFTHYRYKQYYKNNPVEDGVYYAHIKNGKVVSANGEFYKDIDVDVNARVDKETALRNALKNIGSRKYDFKTSYHGIKSKAAEGELIILHTKHGYKLCYKYDVYSYEPYSRYWVYLDANDGSVIEKRNRINNLDVTGTAVTHYSGAQTIAFDSLAPNSYRLRESGRNIETFDIHNTQNMALATSYYNNNNFWTFPGSLDEYALDVHYGAEKAYDFFYNRYGLNSFNDSGIAINCYAHFGVNFTSSLWNGSAMLFGDGYPLFGIGPCTSVEFVAHEYAHGINEYSAGLILNGETAALNESFGDILALAVDTFVHPNNFNWYVGDEAYAGGASTRYIADPNLYLHPDTYNGDYWGSGNDYAVQDYWFYLLSIGGNGTNYFNKHYSIDAIGLLNAADIAYRSLTVYLTPNSTYADAQFYSIKAAEDIHGYCSNEVRQCTNAWYAVGVGDSSISKVKADFSASHNYACGIPVTVDFKNSSINSQSSFWDFGDGDTSTLQNPSHTYTSYSLDTIMLIAYGSTFCPAPDTAYWTINIPTVSSSPIPAACYPQTINYCCGKGILNFKLNTINSTSGDASEGYKDFTCQFQTTCIGGDYYPLTWKLGAGSSNLAFAIDYNNNGTFDLGEYPSYAYNSFTISDSAVLNTPLRVRIRNSGALPCVDINNGQCEDYTVTIVPNTEPPVADFACAVGNTLLVRVHHPTAFSDKSHKVPTSWQWNLTGGTPDTCSLKNTPAIYYHTVGDFPVTLTASNAFGSDSISKTAFVHVVDTFSLCNQSLSHDMGGIIRDPGGDNSYSGLHDCTFLIEPPCANSINLSFTEFDVSTADVLEIYDGDTTEAPLLCRLSGTDIPATVIAKSGKMLLHFVSQSSGDGFNATWFADINPQAAPVASFTVSDSTPPFNTPVKFTDGSSSAACKWYWDFGDGTTSILQNPEQNYLVPGLHTVTLIASNCYSSDTISQIVNVQNMPQVIVNPDSINISLSCDDSITIPITIYNNGLGESYCHLFGKGKDSLHVLTFDTTTYSVFIQPLKDYYPKNTVTGFFIESASNLASALKGKDLMLIDPFPQTYINLVYLGAVVRDFVSRGGAVLFTNPSQYLNFNNFGLLNIQSNLFSTGAPDTLIKPEHPLAKHLNSTMNLPNIKVAEDDIVPILRCDSGVASFYRSYGAGKIIYGYKSYSSGLGPLFLSDCYNWVSNGYLDSWIDLSSQDFLTNPNDSTVINLKISAHGLGPGIHDQVIYIQTNDTAHPLFQIPVILNIPDTPCAIFNVKPAGCNSYNFEYSAYTKGCTFNWSFGDGTTSTLINPVHNYPLQGNYTAKVVVCNSYGCDSVEQLITVNQNQTEPGFILPPNHGLPCCNLGINNVTLNNLNNTSANANVRYEDFTCLPPAYLQCGDTNTLYAQTSGTCQWAVYYDTLLLGNGTLNKLPTINLTPFSYVQYSPVNIPLRLRVYTSDFVALEKDTLGQTEDYALIYTPTPNPPANDFAYTEVDACYGIYKFINKCNNSSSWYWQFGDGDTSTEYNPQHQYQDHGIFPVTLISYNQYGSDTIIKNVTSNTFAFDYVNYAGNFMPGGLIQFSCGTNGNPFLLAWWFGDGGNAGGNTVTHTYTSAGIYSVHIQSNNGSWSCQIDTTFLINIGGVGMPEFIRDYNITVSPNPFNDQTEIKYNLKNDGEVEINVYDVLGKKVSQLLYPARQSAGKHTEKLKLANAGVYFIKVRVNTNEGVVKVVKF